jgi:hypothetical protein
MHNYDWPKFYEAMTLFSAAAACEGLGAPLEVCAAGLRAFSPAGAPHAPTMALLATAARIPTLRDEARERRAIRRLTRRGADPLLLADMFDSVIRAVPQLAIALEVRGVRLPSRQAPPTRRRPSRFGRADLLIVSLSVGGVLVSVARAVAEAILGA